MTEKVTAKEELTKLKSVVEARNVKIEDVKSRIDRQEEHIKKTLRKQDRFKGHLSRWIRQNERDEKRIKELSDQIKPKPSPGTNIPLAG